MTDARVKTSPILETSIIDASLLDGLSSREDSLTALGLLAPSLALTLYATLMVVAFLA